MNRKARHAALSALSLAVAAQVTPAGTASAQERHKHLGNIKWTPGRVNADGTVAGGSDFKAMRNEVGDYVITYSADAFPKAAPIVTCTASDIATEPAICNVANVKWDPKGPTTIEIRMFGLDGASKDAGFNFTEMTPR